MDKKNSNLLEIVGHLIDRHGVYNVRVYYYSMISSEGAEVILPDGTIMDIKEKNNG